MSFAHNQTEAPHSDQQVSYVLSLPNEARRQLIFALDEQSLFELASAISAYLHHQHNDVDELSDLLNGMSVENPAQQLFNVVSQHLPVPNSTLTQTTSAPAFSFGNTNTPRTFFALQIPPREDNVMTDEDNDEMKLDGPK